MKRLFAPSLAGLALLFSSGILEAQIGELSGERMRAHVRYLASDLLEGRGVSARAAQISPRHISPRNSRSQAPNLPAIREPIFRISRWLVPSRSPLS